MAIRDKSLLGNDSYICGFIIKHKKKKKKSQISLRMAAHIWGETSYLSIKSTYNFSSQVQPYWEPDRYIPHIFFYLAWHMCWPTCCSENSFCRKKGMLVLVYSPNMFTEVYCLSVILTNNVSLSTVKYPTSITSVYCVITKFEGWLQKCILCLCILQIWADSLISEFILLPNISICTKNPVSAQLQLYSTHPSSELCTVEVRQDNKSAHTLNKCCSYFPAHSGNKRFSFYHTM